MVLIDPVSVAAVDMAAVVLLDDKAAFAWLLALAALGGSLLGLPMLSLFYLLLLEVVQPRAPPHFARLRQWLSRLRGQCAHGLLPSP